MFWPGLTNLAKLDIIIPLRNKKIKIPSYFNLVFHLNKGQKMTPGKDNQHIDPTMPNLFFNIKCLKTFKKCFWC